MAGIIHRQIETNDPWGGLPPRVHDVPACHVIYPAAGNSNNVYTTANYFTSTATAGANYSVAPATQLDGYGRNVVALFSPNTASSAMYSAGTLVLYGADYYTVFFAIVVGAKLFQRGKQFWRGCGKASVFLADVLGHVVSVREKDAVIQAEHSGANRAPRPV